jgi:hypothetical protein
VNADDRELLMLFGTVGIRVSAMVTGLFEDSLSCDEQLAFAGQPSGLAEGFWERVKRTPFVIDMESHMSRKGGFTPGAAPTGWVFLNRHRADGFTIRWRRRGDAVAYVLNGKRLFDQGMSELLGTIPVVATGWTDLAEVRTLGERWVWGRSA